MKLEVIVNHKLVRLKADISHTSIGLATVKIKTFDPAIVNWLFDRFDDETKLSMKIVGEKSKVFKGVVMSYSPTIGDGDMIYAKACLEGEIAEREVFIFR